MARGLGRRLRLFVTPLGVSVICRRLLHFAQPLRKLRGLLFDRVLSLPLQRLQWVTARHTAKLAHFVAEVERRKAAQTLAARPGLFSRVQNLAARARAIPERCAPARHPSAEGRTPRARQPPPLQLPSS